MYKYQNYILRCWTLIAYVLLRTRLGTSKEIIDSLRKSHEQNFIQGCAVYGWYDALVKLKIPYVAKLNEIIDELKKNRSDIVHIGTVVERTDGYSSFLHYTSWMKLWCWYVNIIPCHRALWEAKKIHIVAHWYWWFKPSNPTSYLPRVWTWR